MGEESFIIEHILMLTFPEIKCFGKHRFIDGTIHFIEIYLTSKHASCFKNIPYLLLFVNLEHNGTSSKYFNNFSNNVSY